MAGIRPGQHSLYPRTADNAYATSGRVGHQSWHSHAQNWCRIPLTRATHVPRRISPQTDQLPIVLRLWDLCRLWKKE
jgi:hypothetical protein